jgi:hypothetical protein
MVPYQRPPSHYKNVIKNYVREVKFTTILQGFLSTSYFRSEHLPAAHNEKTNHPDT